MRAREECQARQIVKGVALLGGLSVLIVSVLIGWRLLPGLLGEWMGTMVGLVSTPFILEGFFATLGLALVIAINHWRQRREGEEFVYLEQVEGPEAAGVLPERSRWAVYPAEPLEAAGPGLLERAEGEWAIGDLNAALQTISEMSAAELAEPATVDLRIRIARATGKHGLADRLERGNSSESDAG